jgi:hypothetical protein
VCPNRIALALTLAIIPASCVAQPIRVEDDQNGRALLEASMQKDTLERVHSQLKALNDIAADEINGTRLLVESLDYYIGEGLGVDRDELIVKSGRAAIDLLENKLHSPLACSEKYKRICMDEDTRNEDIEWLIEKIRQGQQSED